MRMFGGGIMHRKYMMCFMLLFVLILGDAVNMSFGQSFTAPPAGLLEKPVLSYTVTPDKNYIFDFAETDSKALATLVRCGEHTFINKIPLRIRTTFGDINSLNVSERAFSTVQYMAAVGTSPLDYMVQYTDTSVTYGHRQFSADIFTDSEVHIGAQIPDVRLQDVTGFSGSTNMTFTQTMIAHISDYTPHNRHTAVFDWSFEDTSGSSLGIDYVSFMFVGYPASLVDKGGEPFNNPSRLNIQSMELLDVVENTEKPYSFDLKRGDAVVYYGLRVNSTDLIGIDQATAETYTDERLAVPFQTHNITSTNYVGIYGVQNDFQLTNEMVIDKSDDAHYYLLRPLYHVTDEAVSLSDTQMLVPGYMFTNPNITCGMVNIFNGLHAFHVSVSHSDVIDVESQMWDCDSSEIYNLSSPPRFATRLGITFDDITPVDYCSGVFAGFLPIFEFDQMMDTDIYVMQNMFKAVVIPSNNPNIPLRIVIISNSDHEFFQRHYYVQISGIESQSDSFCRVTDLSTADFAYRLIPPGDDSNISVSDFSNTKNFFGIGNITIGETNSYAYQCEYERIEIRGAAIGDVPEEIIVLEGDDARFNVVIRPNEPVYAVLLSVLDKNEFGWGTGSMVVQPDGSDVNAGEAYFMGLPFLTVMVLITAMVGFNRKNIPASAIVYLSVVGIFVATGITQILDAVFSVLILIAMLAIFSKGFR